MDVRAFGSLYGQSASLPYASGFRVNASGTDTTFPACRGVFIESKNKSVDHSLCVILADSPGTPLTFDHIRTDILLPISITNVSGISTVEHAFILY